MSKLETWFWYLTECIAAGGAVVGFIAWVCGIISTTELTIVPILCFVFLFIDNEILNDDGPTY